MATNLFVPFAAGSGANVVTDAQWAALIASGGTDGTGFVQGLAISAQANKAWRQTTLMAAVLGQLIVDLTSVDANDSQSLATLEQNLLVALTSRLTTPQYTTTGSIPQIKVPAGVYSLEYEIWGAGAPGGVGSLGGSIPGAGGPGGSGAKARGRLAVYPGNLVDAFVGSGATGGPSILFLSGSPVVTVGGGSIGSNASGATPGAGGNGGSVTWASGYSGESYSGSNAGTAAYAFANAGGSNIVNTIGSAAFGGYPAVSGNNISSAPGTAAANANGGTGGVGLTSGGSSGQPGGRGGDGIVVIRGLP